MEEGEKKPNKKRDHSGMKKKPWDNVKKNRPKTKKYAPYLYKGRIKAGMSDYQKRTMNEFMKVREGETQEQWLKRTDRRRIKTNAERLELTDTHPLKLAVKKSERRLKEKKEREIYYRLRERDFDFMKYYGIVITYFSFKYSIRVEDYSVGFYFYSNIPFTRNRFENALKLISGGHTGKLKRFIDDGLVEEIINSKNPKKEHTNLYRLTNVFVRKLCQVYDVLGQMNTIQLKQPILADMHPELKQMIQDMNDFIMDVKSGKQQPIK